MSDHDDGSTEPRHRKPGRARKRSSAATGRHLRIVPDLEAAPNDCGCPDGFHAYGVHAPGRRPAGDSATTPAGAYPVEDLVGMSASATAMLLHRATLEAESAAASCAHIVITQDTATGVLTYSGPFDTGLEALRMAQDFVAKYRNLDPRWDFTLTVAPLFGP